MATDPEAAPHIAPIRELARGEEPAIGAHVLPTTPGGGGLALAGRLLLYIVLAAIAAFYFLPFFWSVSTSFKTLPESAQGFVLIPHHPTLTGYREAFTAGPFGRYLMNSAIFAVTVTLTNLFLCTLGGYAFARLRFPGRELLFLLVLGTLMIPDQLRLVPVFVTLTNWHLVGTFRGYIFIKLIEATNLFFFRSTS